MTTSLPLRPRLGDEVARVVREGIMAGDFVRGQRLFVEQLAHDFRISTTPVREALLTLANEGLVEMTPRRGVRVLELLPPDLDDVFAVQAHLAGLLAQRASRTMQTEHIRALRDIQREIERASRAALPPRQRCARVQALNHEFHRQINIAAEGERLRWFLRVTNRYMSRRFFETPGWVEGALADHPRIIDALTKREEAAAAELISDHIARSGRLLAEQRLRHPAAETLMGRSV